MVARLRIATTTRRRNGEQWVDKTNYFTVEVYGAQARMCAQYLGKGSRVVVDGELDWREWTDQENKRREAVTFRARQVLFEGGRRTDGDQAGVDERFSLRDAERAEVTAGVRRIGERGRSAVLRKQCVAVPSAPLFTVGRRAALSPCRFFLPAAVGPARAVANGVARLAIWGAATVGWTESCSCRATSTPTGG